MAADRPPPICWNGHAVEPESIAAQGKVVELKVNLVDMVEQRKTFCSDLAIDGCNWWLKQAFESTVVIRGVVGCFVPSVLVTLDLSLLCVPLGSIRCSRTFTVEMGPVTKELEPFT